MQALCKRHIWLVDRQPAPYVGCVSNQERGEFLGQTLSLVRRPKLLLPVRGCAFDSLLLNQTRNLVSFAQGRTNRKAVLNALEPPRTNISKIGERVIIQQSRGETLLAN